MPKFHIENVNHPTGTEHNRIVRYANVANVVRFALKYMPSGQYMIHELDPVNHYRKPIRSTPAFRRAQPAEE